MNKDLQIAKKTIQTEIQALKKLSSTFNSSSQFSKVVNLLIKMKGKAIIVGVGKSFLIAQKTAASLSSLGTPSLSISASDLGHGGMGIIQKEKDIIIIFSISGESNELNSILNFANRHAIPIVGVSCKSNSNLIRNSSIKNVLPKVKEAGNSLAPTSSSLLLLSWGDCLSIACMKRKGHSNKSFVEYHTEGSLSTSLIKVKDIMSKGKEIPIINANKNMQTAIKEMSKKRLGIVCIKDKSGKINILTDGDLRRHSNNLYEKKILNVCNKNPTWISEEMPALSAIEKMNTLEITTLLVSRSNDVKKKIKKVSGILHLHHCLSRGIK
jgi:arabinose-5-phosphate isomerase